MISVIVATNNFNEYLSIALQSIFDQTFVEFEVLLVANGAACDDIENFVLKRFPSETRLIIIKTNIPQLSYALNLGIDHASYDYIARMDADDIAHPERLGLQLDYLLAHNLDLVGTGARLIDEFGVVIGSRSPPRGAEINKKLPFKNVFIHPSTLIRKTALLNARGYNAGFNSEDYDLWLRLKRLDVRWDNMPDMLLDYRIHPAASQRRLLGYAEISGALLREFLLSKTLVNACSVVVSVIKAFMRAR